MSILHIIVAWLALFAGYLIWIRIAENRKEGRKLLDFGYFNFLVAAFAFVLLVWFGLFLFNPEPDLASSDAKIRYGEATGQQWIISKGIKGKIDSAEDNIDLHFQYVSGHFKQRGVEHAPPDPDEYIAEEQSMFTYYTDLSSSENAVLHDIGHVMLAGMYLLQPVPDYNSASSHLLFVDDPTTKYVNYFAGRIMLTGGGGAAAEEHFFSEIRNKGYKEGAYDQLALLYELTGNDSALAGIVYSGAAQYVPDDIRARVYYREHDVISFYRLKFSAIAERINAWGISGAIGIMLLWSFFLFSLQRVSGNKSLPVATAVLLGFICAMGSWWLYAFYRNGLGFWMTGEIINDLLFSIGGIGFIEELVKLLPFLLILRFSGREHKPIEYIVIASACGLGFAVFENLMYIANYGLDVIHSRALTSSLSHMACSGITAYGFVLWKFRNRNQWWLIPLFFILATGAHGFYDFWLLNSKVQSLGIVTLFFFLSEILVYFAFINNALNQSVTLPPPGELSAAVSASHNFDAQRITSVLAGAFIVLYGFEYLALSIAYGTRYGNAMMTTAFLSGGYLIFFLSARMAQMRIVPGHWGKINVLTGILPSQLLSREEED